MYVPICTSVLSYTAPISSKKGEKMYFRTSFSSNNIYYNFSVIQLLQSTSTLSYLPTKLSEACAGASSRPTPSKHQQLCRCVVWHPVSGSCILMDLGGCEACFLYEQIFDFYLLLIFSGGKDYMSHKNEIKNWFHIGPFVSISLVRSGLHACRYYRGGLINYINLTIDIDKNYNSDINS